MSWQPAIRVDYQPDAEAARHVQVLGVEAARAHVQRHDPRLQRHEDAARRSSTYDGVGELHAERRRCSSRRPSATARTSWPAARRRSPATGAIFCNNGAGCPGESRSSSASNAGLLRAAVPVSGCDGADPDYYAVKALNEIEPPFWDGTRISKVADVPVGQPRRQRAADHRLPRLVQHQLDQRLRDQPDQGHGPAHLQDRLLQHPQLQGGADQHNAFGTINFSRTRSAPIRSIPRSDSRTRRSAPSAPPAGVRNTSRRHRSTTTSRLHPGQLEGEQPADARLRRALRPPAGAVRHAGQASNFLPDKWSLGSAPTLYVAGCADGVYPCTGNNRQAMNP